MSDRQAERGQRVTSLELFFDLVLVFAVEEDGGAYDAGVRAAGGSVV